MIRKIIFLLSGCFLAASQLNRIRATESNEITPVSITHSRTEYGYPAERAIDKDLFTSSASVGIDGEPAWLKLEFDEIYLIEKVVIYYGFYTNWYDPNWWCVQNTDNFKTCVNGHNNVDVSVYKGGVKQKSCGTLQLTYTGLEQSDQIYTFTCNTDGDQIRLEKTTTSGQIIVFEIVTTTTGYISVTCDNLVTGLWIDGVSLPLDDPGWADWPTVNKADIPPGGFSRVAIKCQDQGGQYGIIASLHDGAGTVLSTTDTSWYCKDLTESEEENWWETGSKTEGWSVATSFGKNGVSPWGNRDVDSEAEWIWTSIAQERRTVGCYKDYTGEPGDVGMKGDQGMPGEDGAGGVDGENGYCDVISGACEGEPGDAGLPGDAGVKGDQGEAGLDGSDGIDGEDGAPGEQGVIGPRGESGMKGEHGDIGEDGNSAESNCDASSRVFRCKLGLGRCYGTSSSRPLVKCRIGFAATTIWKNSDFFGLRCCEIIRIAVDDEE